MDHIALTLALIVLAGFGCQWLAWKVKLPSILPLLAVGILIGPVLGWFNPDEMLGDLLHPLVSLAVAIILFEGSLTLQRDEINKVQSVVRKLVSTGALITWLTVSLGMHYLFGLEKLLSILFGALVIVTGPTVIVPMLRTVRPNTKISNILRWEGIIIDPIGALIAVVVYEFIISSAAGGAYAHVALLFLKIILVGFILGFIAGKALEKALEHHIIPEYLQNLATLSLVLFIFSLSNYLAEESGLLAVTVMGIWLANSKVHIEDILNFKENLTVLLISILFIILAAKINLPNLIASGKLAIGAYLIVQFVARPLGVFVSTLKSELTWQERTLLAWIGPRGIVAAAISALFALQLERKGFANADLLVSLTFTVIIGTVLVQSLTAGMIGRWLGVSNPESSGFLIVGANTFARTIATELNQHGIRTIIADTNYENIKTTRMLGINTYYGNPVSGHADQHLDLIGIGKLLALSPRSEVNTISCMRYSAEFGKNQIFQIATTSNESTAQKKLASNSLTGSTLFKNDITFKKLSSLLNSGEAEIKTTRLTKEFTEKDYDLMYPTAIKLFLIQKNGNAEPYTVSRSLEANIDAKVIALVFDNNSVIPEVK